MFKNEFRGTSSEQNFFLSVKARNLLIIILLLGLFLRIYICFFTSLPHIHRDSIDYFQQAGTLLSGGYTNYFPNGYPIIIALSKVIGGSYDIPLLLWFNILMSVVTIYFAFQISITVFKNQTISLLVAFILAIMPTQINYVRWLTSEVPSEFFLVGTYYYYLRERNFVAGLLLGLVIITRTEILPILLLLALLEFYRERKINFRLLAGGMLPILFIAFYCFIKTGYFSIAGHGRVNIMYSTTASGNYVDWYFVDNHPEINTTGKALKLYFEHAKANPNQFIKNRFVNIWDLWGFYPGSSDGNRSIAARLIIGVGNFFMIFFGLTGWWMNRKDFKFFILILPFAIITVVHIFFLALPRYTYPAEPFMIILATGALYRLFKFRLLDKLLKTNKE